MIYAEVIGDPIAHSKSPLIHKYWLQRLGIAADYRKTHVVGCELADFVAGRRTDPDWRGCNVTIPHKQAVVSLLDRLDADAETVGAVNTVVPERGGLAGYNTDMDGIAAALDSTQLDGRLAVVIGAGGAARSLLHYLQRRGAQIRVLARNPAKADELRSLASIEVLPLDNSFGEPAAIINASPLGMSGADRMPTSVLDAVRRHAAGATLFDMVTTPAETQFLTAAREGGGRPVDGLTMLIGQARRGFELFFGASPPAGDEQLRQLLLTDSAG